MHSFLYEYVKENKNFKNKNVKILLKNQILNFIFVIKILEMYRDWKIGYQGLKNRIPGSHGRFSCLLPKTKVLHVSKKDKTPKTSPEDAAKHCKFVCDNPGCGHVFLTANGLKIHKGKCRQRQVFELEKILDSKGPVLTRKYLVRWKGYSADHDTWEPRSNMTGAAELIKEHEVSMGIYDNTWPHRCEICDKPCKSQRGVSIHKTRSHSATPSQCFKGSLAEKKAEDVAVKSMQKMKPTVTCEGIPLDNVYNFKYLGTLFTSTADQLRDVKARVAQAMTRCAKLRNIFDAQDIDLNLKLRLYEASVCSILMFGCETWNLNRETIKYWTARTAGCSPVSQDSQSHKKQDQPQRVSTWFAKFVNDAYVGWVTSFVLDLTGSLFTP